MTFKERFKKIEWSNYFFKLVLKTPERIMSGIVAGVIVYVLLRG